METADKRISGKLKSVPTAIKLVHQKSKESNQSLKECTSFYRALIANFKYFLFPQKLKEKDKLFLQTQKLYAEQLDIMHILEKLQELGKIKSNII